MSILDKIKSMFYKRSRTVFKVRNIECTMYRTKKHRFHSTNGPAYISSTKIMYYHFGYVNNIVGPGIIYKNGFKMYMIKGSEIC